MRILLILVFMFNVSFAMEPIIQTDQSFSVSSLALLEGGTYIAASFTDGSIRVFDASSGRQWGDSAVMKAAVSSIAATENGKKLFLASDRLYLMDVESHALTEITGTPSGMRTTLVAADAGGLSGAGAAGSLLNYYNLTTARFTRSVRAPSEITALVVDSLTQTVYTGGADGFIRAYNIAGGAELGQINAAMGRVTSLALSGDNLLAAGDRNAVLIPKTLADKGKNLSRHTDILRSAAATLDGRFAVTGGDDAVTVAWDLQSGRTESVRTEAELPVLKVAVDPYFRYLVIAEAALGDKGGVLNIRYTGNKRQQRMIYAFRDATLTLDAVGYADGRGPFGKYLSYKSGSKDISFADAANVVHKPEKLQYAMPMPLTAAVKAPETTAPVAFKDTTPPVISVNERGFAPVRQEEILSIEGNITDDSAVAWARGDGRALRLGAGGAWRIETTVPAEGKRIIISAADIYGNSAERVITLTGTATDNSVSDFSSSSRVALLIGVNNYKNLPALRTAEFDVRTMAEVLKAQYGYTPIMLLGENATRDAVLTEINRLRREMNEDDSLIIYYAGHGYLDEDSGNAYWQPYDSLPDEDTRWILTSQLTSNLRASKIGQILVIADSCYSGVVSAGGGAMKAVISSGGSEPVSDLGVGGHSAFAGALIDAIKANPADSAALFAQAKNNLPATVKQTPQYKGFPGDSFKFADEK